MANRRTLDGTVDEQIGQSPLAEPSTMFQSAGGYTGSASVPQRRSMSPSPDSQATEDIIPQYIPPATMGQLFQELRRR